MVEPPPLVILRVVTVAPAEAPASRPTWYGVVSVQVTTISACASTFAARRPCDEPKFMVWVLLTVQVACTVTVTWNDDVAVVVAEDSPAERPRQAIAAIPVS